jgi:hypothetical protein
VYLDTFERERTCVCPRRQSTPLTRDRNDMSMTFASSFLADADTLANATRTFHRVPTVVLRVPSLSWLRNVSIAHRRCARVIRDTTRVQRLCRSMTVHNLPSIVYL